MARLCSICHDPLRNSFVTERLRMGATLALIERESRLESAKEAGLTPIKVTTIARHLAHGFKVREGERLVIEEPVPVPEPVPSPEPVYERAPEGARVTVDVAALVAEKAALGLADGSLRVTTAHGLQAQRMLDARLDKRRDRELAISLAKMLSGQSLVPGHLIVRNVTPAVDAEEFAPALTGGEE